jgi:hypothetical protein
MEAEPTRKGSAPTKVWCRPEGRRGIKAGAGAAGLSVSAYRRKARMSTEARSALDHERIIELAKINAELGRLRAY